MYIFGGKYKKKRLYSPRGSHVRPTAGRLREALFNICQSYIDGATFLDLFAGSGAMGLEALSRGASHVTFVEQNAETASTIKDNISLLEEEEQSKVLIMDVLSALKQLATTGEKFDIVYVDPPYDQGFSQQIITFFDKNSLLQEGGRLFIEDTHFDLPVCTTLKLKGRRRLGRAELIEYERGHF